MWYTKKFIKYAVSTALVLVILYLLTHLFLVFNNFLQGFSPIFIPLIAAGILYYIFRPLCRFLEKKKIPRIVAILIVYLIIFSIFSIIITLIWPYVSTQLTDFLSFPNERLKELETKTMNVMNLFNFTEVSQEQLRKTLIYYLQVTTSWLFTNIINNISSFTKLASFFIITPFVLFYFLKDDRHFSENIVKWCPDDYKAQVKKIIYDADNSCSSFITSQLIVACFVGCLIFLGYAIIGLNYAFLLALLALIFNMIPFCGPFISTLPALFIGLAESPWMCLKVICVVLIVHLIDLNIISPKIVGQRLKIHPVTIVLLLASSVYLFGFLSLFVIIPVYAVLKKIILDVYEISFLNGKNSNK